MDPVLGVISNSLYLIHDPVSGMTFRFADRVGEHTVAGCSDESVWWALSLALCITAAIMLWWGVEKRSMALARGMRPKALR